MRLHDDGSPAIDPRYLSEPEDAETLLSGVELARRIVSMPALAPFAGEELAPGDEPVDSSLRARAQTLYHPVGTCAIGSVVDRERRVGDAAHPARAHAPADADGRRARSAVHS